MFKKNRIEDKAKSKNIIKIYYYNKNIIKYCKYIVNIFSNKHYIFKQSNFFHFSQWIILLFDIFMRIFFFKIQQIVTFFLSIK